MKHRKKIHSNFNVNSVSMSIFCLVHSKICTYDWLAPLVTGFIPSEVDPNNFGVCRFESTMRDSYWNVFHQVHTTENLNAGKDVWIESLVFNIYLM